MTSRNLIYRYWYCCRRAFVCLGLLGAPQLDALTADVDHPGQRISREWQFEVTLDGKTIGTHRFRVEQPDSGETRVYSEASYNVKWLFFTAYQYEHRAEEIWRGDCLLSLQSRTRDGGERFQVHGRPTPEGMRIEVNDRKSLVTGDCLRSFAYWNASLLHRDRLINPQTGEQEPVEFKRGELIQPDWLPKSAISHYRLVTTYMPIDLWYDSDGLWLGLEAEVEGGRLLRYRPMMEPGQHSEFLFGEL